MNITWEVIVLILGIAGGVTGLISFISAQKKQVAKEATDIVVINKNQDNRITQIAAELHALQAEVKEFKLSHQGSETRIFQAIESIGKKVDNLITALMSNNNSNK